MWSWEPKDKLWFWREAFISALGHLDALDAEVQAEMATELMGKKIEAANHAAKVTIVENPPATQPTGLGGK